MSKRVAGSGDCFDLRVLNVCGVFIGFPNEFFQAVSVGSTLCFKIPVSSISQLLDHHSQLISFLRTLSLGQLSRRAQDSGNRPPRDSFGHLEDDDWVHGNRSRDFEPLSDAEAKSLEFTWRSLLKWLWLSLDPSVQPGCRYQYNPHSGSLAQCSVRSENRVMLTSIQNDPHSPRKRAPDDSLKFNCEIPDGMLSGVVAAAMSEPPEVQSQTLRL